MVEGGAVGGEYICRSGDGLAASLPISSTTDVDVSCQRPPCPLAHHYPMLLLPPLKTAEEVGSEAANVEQWQPVSDPVPTCHCHPTPDRRPPSITTV
jgi:hypothetical protein